MNKLLFTLCNKSLNHINVLSVLLLYIYHYHLRTDIIIVLTFPKTDNCAICKSMESIRNTIILYIYIANRITITTVKIQIKVSSNTQDDLVQIGFQRMEKKRKSKKDARSSRIIL